MEACSKNQSIRRVSFEKFLGDIEGFLLSPAMLRDTYFECSATLKRIQSKEGRLVLTFSNLKRRARFSGKNFERFHEKERKVPVSNKTRFESMQNGRVMYIALAPGVNNIYLNKAE